MHRPQCVVLLSMTLALPAVAQKQAATSPALKTNQPPNLTAPTRVGRYTRGEFHDFGTKARGVGYRYSAGDSTDLTVFLYQREPKAKALSAEDAIRDQVQLFTRALEIEKAQGMLGDYEMAFTEPDSVAFGARTIPGWQLGYVFRRGDRLYLSVLLLFATGDSFVKVRATIPQSEVERSDIPSFAHIFVTQSVQPRR